MFFVVMLTPSTMVAQNIGEWQESCDSSVVEVNPIDLIYNRRELLVPVNDKRNIYSGWVYGNLSLKEVKNQWTARLSKGNRIKWKRFNGFHILNGIASTSGSMANFIFGNHIFICMKGYVDSGKEEGLWKYYFIAPNYNFLFMEATYNAGKLNGCAKYYTPDGLLYQEIEFVNDIIDGNFILYDADGIIEKRIYKNGSIVSTERFKEYPNEEY